MSNTEVIKRNFSRYAGFYDDYSGVQDRAGAKLIDFIEQQAQFGRILDIGCGTGNYTSLLRKRFPSAAIMALDICPEMISIADRKLRDKKIEFIMADAESVVFNEDFDLITSNACFQWFNNLDAAVKNYSGVLRADGIILFSVFGPRTFHRLRKCLTGLYKKNIRTSSSDFIASGEIEQILGRYFDRFFVEEQVFEQTYDSLWSLLNTIKYTGTRGNGIGCRNISRGQIIELERIYKKKFGAITAAHHVLYCRAQKGAGT